ncbi:bifunctional UDP-N-acetylglucosamine diphosphorylase/glucosamine-1-phosphate N-acetyltransferase GlmU [Facklamia sp. 7083-14-GEN3]|uniref:bifunctional UDP-N-acetylglucosamine diphosphorylase/glucosamine-1-phosphate N-acetyltransferase GlmU n=1 Tax=Facklamia sp. 7083-14-GEN3 TaxID=2973478 RepID=UPI00215BE8CF|nr:bifunctional UDP-N-acetylglucosamine diphosphorylase/glucosamine-1-phosphate N-acetyltransferase GlmU [Facklamia sp. 7083-14-GEN3]MCR8969981.1 bifunctional UDP-N-acetylglucosamine diphosphorylase/glucosamine-1-phosphate N-acetyltransferase GlmU [Facklamia sp. 7083-14-GEN3]
MKRMAVILAAGKGTRMKSSLPKVLHKISGISMVEHVVRSVLESNAEQIVTIVGNGADLVKAQLKNLTDFAFQSEQLGTGHAVLQAENLLANEKGSTLVICGDTPLLSGDTLNKLFEHHESTGSKATVLTAKTENPKGYGRIVRDDEGQVLKIVEQKDASAKELLINEINTGTYIFDNLSMFAALKSVSNQNAQGEYYLPDIIEILQKQGEKVYAFDMKDFEESLGVNDRVALSRAQQLMNRRIITNHMQNGVSFINPETTYIESDVKIGEDTVIEGGVQLKGETIIGKSVIIGANSEVVDSQIGDSVIITQSVVEKSKVEDRVEIGPFAHLRPKSHLAEGVRIGNFVEVKNSQLGKNTKAGHLAYIGDADIGQDVNVSCGVIFCNYDGKRKYRSKVGDQVFLGSNSNIVSPVEIGDRAFVAAGSTIVKDVEAEALAISRSEQVNKLGYWTKYINK